MVEKFVYLIRFQQTRLVLVKSSVTSTLFHPYQNKMNWNFNLCPQVQEIMLIATAAAAASKSCDLKSMGTNCPAASPILTRSPSLQSTGSALPSPRAQPYPIQRNSLCKLQAGNYRIITWNHENVAHTLGFYISKHALWLLTLVSYDAELPMARRHSLQRFFEKRRDRYILPSLIRKLSGWNSFNLISCNVIYDA